MWTDCAARTVTVPYRVRATLQAAQEAACRQLRETMDLLPADETEEYFKAVKTFISKLLCRTGPSNEQLFHGPM